MTLPAFRPSELMRLAREIRVIAASIHTYSLALSYPEVYNRERTEDKLFGLVHDFINLKDQVEAIALDHHASFYPRLKIAIKKLLDMFRSLNPISISVLPNQILVGVEKSGTDDVSHYDLVFLSMKLLERSTDIQAALIDNLDEELAPESRKNPPEVIVAWWAKAPTELVPYLKEADELTMLPHSFKEERPKCGWDDFRKALNKFLVEHAPRKQFKFSVRGNHLRVIPKTSKDD